MKSDQEIIQIIIIGDTAVGKTSILSRFCDNSNFANDHISTLGIDFKHKVYNSKKGT